MLQSPSAAEGGGAAKSDLLAGAAVQLASGNRSRRSMSTRKARLDDDVTDDEAQAASAAKRPALTAAGDRPMSPRAAARQVPEQIADCEAKLRELQASKEQRLKQEDFLGAHQVKQLVQVEEERLAALRRQLDSMPTPARRPAPAPSPSPKAPAASPKAPSPAADTPKSVPRGPRVSLSLGWAASQARQALQGLRHSPRSVESSGDAVSSAAASAAAKAVAALSCGDDAAEQAEAQDVAGGDAETPEADAEAEETMEVDDEEQDGEWHVSESQPSRVNLKDGDSFHLPKETFDRLYPYQRAGVAWMARLFQKRQGGILADEMGLGKTIQVCSLLNGARKAGATHALILMPVSLLDQWAKEARIWCPGWPVYTYYGTAAQRAMALRRVRRPQGGILLTSYALIGNTEDLLQVNVDDCPSPPYVRGRRPRTAADVRAAKRRKHDDDDGLGEAEDSADEPQEVELPAQLPPSGQWRPWDLVICDEAHRMKNISTLLGKSLRRLQADCRLLLTGTPVQNALQDLWALMDFAQPGLLGNHATFVKTFSDPIDRGSVRGAKVWAVELKKHLADQMRALIGPHILRRTKVGAGLTGVAVDDEEGADEAEEDQEGVVRKLPPKKETIIWLKPTEDQSVSYQKVLEKSEVIREAAAKQKLSIEVFRAIGLLKRLCNHPLLCLPTPKAGAWPELLSEVTAAQAQLEAEKAAAREAAEAAREAAEAAEVSDLEAEPLDLMASEAAAESLDAMGKATAERDDARCGRAVETMLRKLSRSAEALLNQSAKLQCLSELIPSLTKRGHRMLVFSQSVKMLDLIQILILKPNGLRCLRIDGQTDPMSRADKVSKFNNQRDRFQCMLLTTNVGGVGLNLTSANRVIMVDPAWNPATDAQAVDRAFRIGQEKEVRVYRLIMSGMIEDKMFRLQVFKMGLTRTALESSQTHNYFTAREIRALFEWTEAEESETMKLLADKHGEEVNEQVRRMADEDGATAPLPDDDDDDDDDDVDMDDAAAGAAEAATAGAAGEEDAAEPYADAAAEPSADVGAEQAPAAEAAATPAGAQGGKPRRPQGWMEGGKVVGLSDFTLLYQAVAQEETPDQDCAEQVTEAKEKLSAADEKLHLRQEARKAAEEEKEQVAKELEEASGVLERCKEQRAKTEETLKERRSELVQVRRSESSAQLRLEKARKTRDAAEEKLIKEQQALAAAVEAAGNSERSSGEASAAAQAAEEAFVKATTDVESLFSTFGPGGAAIGTGAVDANKAKLTKAQRAMEKVNLAVENAGRRQAELDVAEEELKRAETGLVEAEANLAGLGSSEGESPQEAAERRAVEATQKSREKERQRAEQAQSKARDKAEAAREGVIQALQTFQEVGLELAESFDKAKGRNTTVMQVKAEVVAANKVIRGLSWAWQAFKKAREVATRAVAARRKAHQKLVLTTGSEADASKAQAEAALELVAATSEEEARRIARGETETELVAAETARGVAEAEETEAKRRKEELKAAQPLAKEAVQTARKAEKEAMAERQGLHSTWSKVEKEANQLEAAKSSAIETLRSETYDVNQVQKAYEVQQKTLGKVSAE